VLSEDAEYEDDAEKASVLEVVVSPSMPFTLALLEIHIYIYDELSL
jgi:hypothetical protein